MKLSPTTWARERPQRYPMPSAQPEQLTLSAPTSAGRAKDFHECKRCQQPCGYCDELHPFGDE
jgi:hypothetical protein